MNKILLIVILLVVTTTACSKERVKKRSLRYDDFSRQLKPEMKYASIIEKFGQPDTDIGSGIHIYVYKLEDDTEIWIGYTDGILYARHMDGNQNLLHVII